jgi:hypothetical protein
MRLRKYFFWITLGCAMSISSCEDDFEAVPVEQFTLDFVFSETDSLGEQAHNFLNNVYSRMMNGHNRVGMDYLDAATDDAVSSSLTRSDVEKLATGNYTASTRVGSDMRWYDFYSGIRSASIFINNIHRVPLMATFGDDEIPMNVAWKSEARFVRALHYFELIKRYGGVPLMGNEVRELGENMEIPRSSFKDCVNYIVSELDEIRDSLRTDPLANPSAVGHVVSSGASMALKARVLLYAASPLFNGGNLDPDNELTGYTDYDAERWRLAAEAANDVIDNFSRYSLSDSYGDIFTAHKSENPEIIFSRFDGLNTNIEFRNGPVGFTGNNKGDGNTSPSQNLVDAFPMLDGKSIHESTKYPYEPTNMYANRDPRLEETVLHNGSQWLNSTLETFRGGTHNPGGAVQKTKTSYYLRKFLGDFETESNYSSTVHNWIMFRYAEILLNYAEAINEYEGPTGEVYQVLFDLRVRAGIEAGDDNMYGIEPDLTKEEMRKVIQRERRIEMAFEEHRYWDIRRWKIAAQVYAKPVKGLVIINSQGNMEAQEINVLEPAFDQKQYLYPIPYGEVIKNNNIIQNPGWEG